MESVLSGKSLCPLTLKSRTTLPMTRKTPPSRWRAEELEPPMNVRAWRFGATAGQNSADSLSGVSGGEAVFADVVLLHCCLSATLPAPPLKKVGFFFRLVLAWLLGSGLQIVGSGLQIDTQ